MAKHERENTTDKPSSKAARPQKPKKGFWASLFEPVNQDPDADFFFEEFLEERDTSESEALLGELLDDAEGAEDTLDADAVERITWEDGAPVVTDVPHEGGAYGGEFAARATEDEDTAGEAYSILSGSFAEDEPEAAEAYAEEVSSETETAGAAADAPYEAPLSVPPDTIELVAESVVVEEPSPAFTPPAFFYSTPTPDKVQGTPEGYVPLTSEIDAAAAAPVPEPEPVSEPSVDGQGYVPLTSEIDAGTTMVPYAPPVPAVQEPAAVTGYVPLQSAIDGAQIAPYAPGVTGAPVVSYGVPMEEPAVTDISQAEWFDYASGAFAAGAQQKQVGEEPIDLFDDDLTDTERTRRGQTTRLFRTGTSATTRIHINETEEAVRREEAARRAEAREAKRRQDAAAMRRNKHKKRSSVLRGLFANIAFVLFFIAVVVVALYYGFLLSDIVVMGNEQFTSEYIEKESGLVRGRHMLFCDLDEAKAKIAENPLIQVESVTYIFPNRIRIIVSERKEVAGIAGLDYNVIIDDQGYVLSMSPGTDLSGLLQVSGVSMTGFRLGQRLGEGNDFSTATLIEIIGKLEQYELMDDVTSIDLTTPLAITMKAKNGLTVHVGQGTDLDTKMAMLSKLLPRFFEQSIGTGTLYLSAKGGAVYSPPYAAGNAQSLAAAGTGDADNPDMTLPLDDPSFVDDDGDGLDDVTGLPQGQAATPMPGATPAPTPAPTAYVPGGGADDFSG